MRRGAALLAAALAIVPAPAAAQLGELQAGIVAGFGAPALGRSSAGLVFGAAPGRLAYVGLRWTQYAVARDSAPGLIQQTRIRTTMEEYALDLAAMIPAGPVDVMVGFTTGLAHFGQRVSPSGGAWQTHWAEEMLFAPGVAVEVHVGRFAVIPEGQLCLSGTPDFRYPAHHRGLRGGVRVVWTKELRRITR